MTGSQDSTPTGGPPDGAPSSPLGSSATAARAALDARAARDGVPDAVVSWSVEPGDGGDRLLVTVAGPRTRVVDEFLAVADPTVLYIVPMAQSVEPFALFRHLGGP